MSYDDDRSDVDRLLEKHVDDLAPEDRPLIKSDQTAPPYRDESRAG